MLPNTQRRITAAVYKVWADLAPLLGRESLTHSEGIRLFGQSGLPVSLILQSAVWKAVSPEVVVTPKFVQQQLTSIGTEEKFEAFLLQLPEPTYETLQKVLTFIKAIVPGVRERLTENAKQLPHDPGGRPKKITSTEERQKVREEVIKLREPGKKLNDIFSVVARRHNVSPSKIKKVWYGYSESKSQAQERPRKASRTAKPRVPLKKR